MLDDFGSIQRLVMETQPNERQVRLALAYRDAYPEEMAVTPGVAVSAAAAGAVDSGGGRAARTVLGWSTVYSVAVSKSRHTAAKRAAGSSSLRPATAQIDQLRAATRTKSSRFNAATVAKNFEKLFEQMYRRCRAGLPADDLMEHRAPAPHAASSAGWCA